MELKNSQDNLHIFKMVQSVPQEAQRPFTSDYGKKLTEIDPMWRIKKLTELFGAAGEGWYTEVTRQESVSFSTGETCIFTDVNLYIKDSKTGKWSKPIRGTGGNKLAMMTKDGLIVDDEAYKKAYTDALGIACKALGFGADIYAGKENTKYPSRPEEKKPSDGLSNTPIQPTEAAEVKPGPAPARTEGLPSLTPEHPRWSAFISWAAKKPADKTSDSLKSAIRKQWMITDADFSQLMELAGRHS